MGCEGEEGELGYLDVSSGSWLPCGWGGEGRAHMSREDVWGRYVRVDLADDGDDKLNNGVE